MFAQKNAAQFPALAGRPMPNIDKLSNYGAEIHPTILFDEEYSFKLGGLTFNLYHAPGETYDHLYVHIPERRILFTGDNFYYSLNKTIGIRPAVMAPSHGDPRVGVATIMFAINN